VASLAVNNNGGVLRQPTEDVRFDFVLFLFGEIAGHLAAGVAPRFLDDALLAEEVGAFQCAFFVGGFEDEPVAEVQREDAGFFPAEGRDE
jgi:hypothetical protein